MQLGLKKVDYCLQVYGFCLECIHKQIISSLKHTNKKLFIIYNKVISGIFGSNFTYLEHITGVGINNIQATIFLLYVSID